MILRPYNNFFDLVVLLPPKNGIPSTTLIKKNNIITKRFALNASSLATLRDKYNKDEVRSSRVEALTAFIWSRFVAAMQDKSVVACNSTGVKWHNTAARMTT
ncbi:hypothetical protein SLE2022_136990 [Rubroshorea leprosula]